MLDFLTNLFTGLFGFLDQMLPNSPFGDWAVVTNDMHLGLGWLNWLFDLSGCLAIFVVWITLAVTVTIAKIIYTHTKDLYESLEDRVIS